jgi:hypothetical protein
MLPVWTSLARKHAQGAGPGHLASPAHIAHAAQFAQLQTLALYCGCICPRCAGYGVARQCAVHQLRAQV